MKLRSRILVLSVLIFAALLIAGYYAALHLLKSQIEEALGPRGEVQALGISGLSVEIRGLRIRAEPTRGKSGGALVWPAEDELRAERILVSPSLRSLLSDTIVVSRIQIEHAYLPLLRTSKGMQLLPSLLGRKPKEPDGDKAPDSADATGKIIRIGRVEFVDSQIDFFDATVSRKPHRIPLHELNGHIDNLKLPALDEPEALAFTGSIPAAGQTGSLSLEGTLTPSTLDSRLKLALRKVPLLSLQPYFIKAAETDVKRGTLQLDLDSTVKQRRLHAPGNLVLQGLELSGGNEFAGLSRQAAVALLRDKKERIDLKFSLDGNLDDPKFSINEEFYVRVGAALADALGVSLEGLGKGAVDVGQGVGSILRGLMK